MIDIKRHIYKTIKGMYVRECLFVHSISIQRDGLNMVIMTQNNIESVQELMEDDARTVGEMKHIMNINMNLCQSILVQSILLN